eukprot:TRINITY_DN540_c0_g2_i1.p1 TRINITY_DN540_c0_g2~~TRINITY_DN540_c0_g2_i1.p1  ORF type:complete len:165 (+),score=5.73 TRINITY_DN540_c0_g2_i1:183-677(+)
MVSATSRCAATTTPYQQGQQTLQRNVANDRLGHKFACARHWLPTVFTADAIHANSPAHLHNAGQPTHTCPRLGLSSVRKDHGFRLWTETRLRAASRATERAMQRPPTIVNMRRGVSYAARWCAYDMGRRLRTDTVERNTGVDCASHRLFLVPVLSPRTALRQET